MSFFTLLRQLVLAAGQTNICFNNLPCCYVPVSHVLALSLASQDMEAASYPSLQELFLNGCKAGDVGVVAECVKRGVDVNCSEGWGLRRSIRYNRPLVWQHLLACPNIEVNLMNQHGLSALHTAAR